MLNKSFLQHFLHLGLSFIVHAGFHPSCWEELVWSDIDWLSARYQGYDVVARPSRRQLGSLNKFAKD
jgi:hypothetical protein